MYISKNKAREFLSIILFALFSNISDTFAEECKKRIWDDINPEYVESSRQRYSDLVYSMQKLKRHETPPSEMKKLDQSISVFQRTKDISYGIAESQDRAFLTFYLGNDIRQTNDGFVLPADERIACLLLPGTGVLLSDGITHHYNLIDTIDIDKGTVRFFDLWAKSSFLRKNANVLGIDGHPIIEPDKPNRIEIKISELAIVLRGIVIALDHNDFLNESGLFFDLIESNYEKELDREHYEIWKSGAIISNATHKDLMDNILSPFGLGNPNKMIFSLYDDIIRVIPLNFLGKPLPKAKEDFHNRLNSYVKFFPPSVFWKMISIMEYSTDPDITAWIIGEISEMFPYNIDFRIKKYEYDSIYRGIPIEKSEAEKLFKEFEDGLLNELNFSTVDEAYQYLLSYNGANPSLNSNKIRFARISLLQLSSGVLPKNAEDERLNTMLSMCYSTSCKQNFTYDFFSSLLTILNRNGDYRSIPTLYNIVYNKIPETCECSEDSIRQMQSKITYDFVHFLYTQNIDDKYFLDHNQNDASIIKNRKLICSNSVIDNIYPGEITARRQKMNNICAVIRKKSD